MASRAGRAAPCSRSGLLRLRHTTGCRQSRKPRAASRSSASSSENATYTVARSTSLCVRLSRWRWQRSSGASVRRSPDENERRDAERPKKVPVRPVTGRACESPCLTALAGYSFTLTITKHFESVERDETIFCLGAREHRTPPETRKSRPTRGTPLVSRSRASCLEMNGAAAPSAMPALLSAVGTASEDRQ